VSAWLLSTGCLRLRGQVEEGHILDHAPAQWDNLRVDYG